jgi:hypothetical protein
MASRVWNVPVNAQLKLLDNITASGIYSEFTVEQALQAALSLASQIASLRPNAVRSFLQAPP